MDDNRLQKVRAETLKGAMQKVRRKFGENACIVESRNVVLRQDDGLGQEKLVEIIVDPAGETRSLGARIRKPPQEQAAPVETVSGSLLDEVARIEKLVDELAGERRELDTHCELSSYPLASLLLRRGTSPESVRRLAESFSTETLAGEMSLPAARRHLHSQLRCADADWSSLGGCHVFLGDCGAGKSDLVLGAAAALRKVGRTVLVLNLLPRHGGEVRRLQLEAAEHGYDAAVIKSADRFEGAAKHLTRYDAVLIDTPALFGPDFAEFGKLHGFISQNESFHRHLVLPMDRDLRDCGDIWEAGRVWNCDWLAISRMDRSRKPGKLLDLVVRFPRPVAFCTSAPWPFSAPAIGNSDRLVEMALGSHNGMEANAEG